MPSACSQCSGCTVLENRPRCSKDFAVPIAFCNRNRRVSRLAMFWRASARRAGRRGARHGVHGFAAPARAPLRGPPTPPSLPSSAGPDDRRPAARRRGGQRAAQGPAQHGRLPTPELAAKLTSLFVDVLPPGRPALSALLLARGRVCAARGCGARSDSAHPAAHDARYKSNASRTRTRSDRGSCSVFKVVSPLSKNTALVR